MIIFFDIDDTLMNHKRAEKLATLSFLKSEDELFKLSEAAFLALWHRLAEKYMDEYLEGKITFQQQRIGRMKELYQEFGHTLTDRDATKMFLRYLENYERSWSLFSDVLGCLNACSGHSLGIISNGNSLQQRQKLSALGIKDNFKAIVISEELGVSKPDHKIFNEASKRADTDIASCIYIGDRLATDAEAACRAGMRGIWLNRNKEVPNSKGIETVNCLSQVVNLL